jgi:hypothetical protein
VSDYDSSDCERSDRQTRYQREEEEEEAGIGHTLHPFTHFSLLPPPPSSSSLPPPSSLLLLLLLLLHAVVIRDCVFDLPYYTLLVNIIYSQSDSVSMSNFKLFKKAAKTFLNKAASNIQDKISALSGPNASKQHPQHTQADQVILNLVNVIQSLN